MSDQNHAGNPLAESAQAGMKHATEIATMLMMGLQRLTHIRSRQEQLAQSRIDTDRRALQGELRTIQARDRLVWEPALQADFCSATMAQATRAWTAAQPWAGTDPQAARAAHQAEQRMRDLDPVLMAPWDGGRRHEPEPSPDPGVTQPIPQVDDLVDSPARAAAASAWSVGGEQRETAVQESASPDQAATVSVDEHAAGVQIASAFAPPADTNMAKAAALASQAFPRPLQVGLPVAPGSMPSVSNTATLTQARGR
ncbi:MAG: hypothetical protein WA797_04140 [Acidimicrobiales bacterium]